MKKPALALLVLGLAAPALARPPGHGGPPGPPPHELVLDRADELGLDDATLAAIEALSAGAEAEHDALREALREAHEAMRALMQAEAPDRDAALRQLEVIGDAEVALRKHHVGLELELRALLTPEQWDAVRPRPPQGPPGLRGPGRSR